MDAAPESLPQDAPDDRKLAAAADDVDAGDVLGRAVARLFGAFEAAHHGEHRLDRALDKGRARLVELRDGDRDLLRARPVAERCLDVALAFAFEREQFGAPIFDYQGVAFQLADCAVELQAARAMTYQVAWEIDRKQVDPKTLHAKAASVKLFASQMGNRVADRCVQVLGGRGYMRENPVERFYRELRVDRIWEGTSEIQKLIVANELKKRGRDALCAWPGTASSRPGRPGFPGIRSLIKARRSSPICSISTALPGNTNHALFPSGGTARGMSSSPSPPTSISPSSTSTSSSPL
jgi:hypothetical protein